MVHARWLPASFNPHSHHCGCIETKQDLQVGEELLYDAGAGTGMQACSKHWLRQRGFGNFLSSGRPSLSSTLNSFTAAHPSCHLHMRCFKKSLNALLLFSSDVTLFLFFFTLKTCLSCWFSAAAKTKSFPSSKIVLFSCFWGEMSHTKSDRVQPCGCTQYFIQISR